MFIRASLRGAALLALAVLAFAPSFLSPAAALEPFGARHPALSPDGSQLAFSWRGDIWVAAAAGGAARQLTNHLAYEAQPRWSPDGRELAFMSDRNGNADLFVVAAAGGVPERLTTHSDYDELYDWSADGKTLYFGSNRESREFLLYAVPRAGGRPVRVVHDQAWSARLSPDGQWIAYVRGYTEWWRRGYRGPASRDIWLRRASGGPSLHLIDWPGDDDLPHWSGDGRALFFQSEREDGVKNLWRQDLRAEGGDLRAAGAPAQITRLADDMGFLSVSRDGRFATYESAGRLWVVPTAGGTPVSPAIDCPGDDKANAVTRRVLDAGATEYAFAPGEKQLAFVVEGELYAGLVREGELKDCMRITETAAREKDIAWLDDKSLLFVSDREGGEDIYVMRSTDKEEPRLGRSRYRETQRLTSDTATEFQPQPSPDGKTILYRKGTGWLWAMAPDGGGQRRLVDEPVVLHCDWSPDSKWLAYSTTNHGSAEDIFIVDAAGKTAPVNVSSHPNDDFHPLWSGDGKRLAWASRTQDGYYSVKYLWLTRAEAEKTKSQREREEEAEEDKEAATDAKDDGDDKKDKDDKKAEEPAVTVKIDWDDLPARTRTVATLRGYYWDYDQSPDGKHYALRSDLLEGAMDLWTVDWDGDNLRRLTAGGADPDRLLWSEDSESVRYISGGRINEIADDPEGETKTYGFSVPITVDGAARRAQKFDEAWRRLGDGFYDEHYHGADWQALRAKYAPLAAAAVTHADFKDVLKRLFGELNASHLGSWGGPKDNQGDDATGLLGFTPDDAYTGPGLRVARVLARGPLDREETRVAVGEVILAIDGHEIAPGEDYYPLLGHKAGEEVDLLIAAAGPKGKTRTITVEPRASVWELDYRQWMDETRALVDKASGGRIGYLHMAAMGDEDWPRFLEDLFARAHGKDGLILDVRDNNGGSIHDQVLTVLSRQPYVYSKNRGKREGQFDAIERWDRPIVLLTNERSYSDGEIFPWGFHALGLGRIVGMPTFGAVIGTNNVPLIDGTVFRIPSTGWWRRNPDGSIGSSLENDPVQPDLRVPAVPEEALAGRDAQVEAGVAECLRMIETGWRRD